MANTPFDKLNDPIEHRLVAGLTKISLALKSHFWQDAGFQGLTPTQGQILALLQSRSESVMRLSEVASGLATTPATASDAVAVLVEKGLVQKNRAADDGRAIAIALTSEGKREAIRVASWPDFLLDTINELSVQEQEVFLRSLIKIIRKLQERGQIPISHMCVTCCFFRPNLYPNSDLPHHCALVDAPFGDRHLRLECPEHVLSKLQVVEQV